MSHASHTAPACAIPGARLKGVDRVVKRRNRAKLGKEHEKIWKDVFGYPTNKDAATAISGILHSVVQVQTIRRRFGPSGRTTGRAALPPGKGAQTTTSRIRTPDPDHARYRESPRA